ncbi:MULTISPECIES: NADPH-dependent F420 reductase [unclassified Rhodococcus (in: high G+C Gram-positive bacteria)]|uniref:NADPH-dependent F420 reductase n=1 Tax=unclassified Rhodococcus (in: high G+C Gram-positive bacteria) TaxID=192944 RepID=UPI000B9C31D5|nr:MULTISPECIES: NAD(P)-binding domain-containing protein [unclassified Rhodococcus (in: high G+C Gram-positive bacteria)]OZE31240.1 diguanylate cyclase [Rhodococcus sp. 05-2254-4]OZE41849.1 diguanylate cyclase [Rhodococcus sp. 05-2254-3]OZE52284.1 diguanylate cyclase [Rhodococcus sp. 05-2254-2]
MAAVSVIGTGNMGKAIAALAVKGGHSVQVLARADSDTPVSGDIVVLALPFAALDSVVAERGASFAGRIVVDITNPVNFETFDSLTVPADSSATAYLAAALPNSHVLKAFNTNFAGTLVEGKIGQAVTTVLIAGDDSDAKSSLADVVGSAGLAAVDAGSLGRARELESVGFLQMTLAAGEKISWSGGFALTS